MAVALTYLPVALRLGITVGDSSDDPDADPDTSKEAAAYLTKV